MKVRRSKYKTVNACGGKHGGRLRSCFEQVSRFRVLGSHFEWLAFTALWVLWQRSFDIRVVLQSSAFDGVHQLMQSGLRSVGDSCDLV